LDFRVNNDLVFWPMQVDMLQKGSAVKIIENGIISFLSFAIREAGKNLFGP